MLQVLNERFPVVSLSGMTGMICFDLEVEVCFTCAFLQPLRYTSCVISVSHRNCIPLNQLEFRAQQTKSSRNSLKLTSPKTSSHNQSTPNSPIPLLVSAQVGTFHLNLLRNTSHAAKELLIAELLGECHSGSPGVPKDISQEGVSKSTSPNKKLQKACLFILFKKKKMTISVAPMGLEDGSCFYALKAPHPTPLLREGRYLHGNSIVTTPHARIGRPKMA